jgi:hypothetical protein
MRGWYDAGMSEVEASIDGRSIRGTQRRLTRTRGQPGMVALTIHAGSAATVIVPVATLRAELDRLDERLQKP